MITEEQKIERLKREIAKLETAKKAKQKKSAVIIGNEVLKYLDVNQEDTKIIIIGLLEYFTKKASEQDREVLKRAGVREIEKRREKRKAKS